jgi:hypothetical protein
MQRRVVWYKNSNISNQTAALISGNLNMEAGSAPAALQPVENGWVCVSFRAILLIVVEIPSLLVVRLHRPPSSQKLCCCHYNNCILFGLLCFWKQRFHVPSKCRKSPKNTAPLTRRRESSSYTSSVTCIGHPPTTDMFTWTSFVNRTSSISIRKRMPYLKQRLKNVSKWVTTKPTAGNTSCYTATCVHIVNVQ